MLLSSRTAISQALTDYSDGQFVSVAYPTTWPKQKDKEKPIGCFLKAEEPQGTMGDVRMRPREKSFQWDCNWDELASRELLTIGTNWMYESQSFFLLLFPSFSLLLIVPSFITDVNYSWLSVLFSPGEFKAVSAKQPKPARVQITSADNQQQCASAEGPQSSAFSCPKEGCVKVFQRSSALECTCR